MPVRPGSEQRAHPEALRWGCRAERAGAWSTQPGFYQEVSQSKLKPLDLIRMEDTEELIPSERPPVTVRVHISCVKKGFEWRET